MRFRGAVAILGQPMNTQHGLTLANNQPLIGIPFVENGQEVVRYFSEEAQADKAVQTMLPKQH